jgi:integrase
LGRIPLSEAKDEALAANQHLADTAPTLVQRLTGAGKTFAELLDMMPAAANENTAKTNRSMDKRLREILGAKLCCNLTVADFGDLLAQLVDDDKVRAAQALRSRMVVVCRKGMARGWLDFNPAESTESPEPEVKRGRLTLDMFMTIYEKAPGVCEWLQQAMRLALVTGQDRSTICDMQRSHIADGYLTVWRSKTRGTNQPVDIPLSLGLTAVGWSLADLVKNKTNVVSRYLVHHVRPWGNAPAGASIHVNNLSRSFTDARILAGIPDIGADGKGAPTFHEIRSLAKRLYTKQGGVDTKALLGHSTDKAADLYADPRGVEHIRVRVA